MSAILTSPREYQFRSRLQGPIAELSTLQRSLLFAELSWISYLDHEDVKQIVRQIGLEESVLYHRDGAEAYVFVNQHDCVVTCRGTEPDDWNDIRADANALTAVAESVGRVHRGFKKEVDDVWPFLLEALTANQRPLWITGHSLGGAMASICAGRCFLADLPSKPRQLVTFGSPRVGNRRYVNYIAIDYLRWVNNNDIVPHVPPTWLGYRHAGKEMYLNSKGKLRRITGLRRIHDRWRGFWNAIRRGSIDQLADHGIRAYVAAITQLVEHEEASAR